MLDDCPASRAPVRQISAPTPTFRLRRRTRGRSQVGLLVGRLGRVVANNRALLAASRNLDVFQSAYRYIIILLPAAVVAPLFFRARRPRPGSVSSN